MKRILLIAAVAISAVVIGILSFMNGTLIWDGGAYVPISVSVFDDERRPVSGAFVSLILPRDESFRELVNDEDFDELLRSDHRLFETDDLGTGTLGGRFPAGGRAGIFKKRGQFRVVGDILINHPEFQDFHVSLRNLLQAYEFSIDQTELKLIVFLDAGKAGSGRNRD